MVRSRRLKTEKKIEKLRKGEEIFESEELARGGLYFERLANPGLKYVRHANLISNIEISRAQPTYAPRMDDCLELAPGAHRTCG